MASLNPKTTGRRATLAKWITLPANPLTARVHDSLTGAVLADLGNEADRESWIYLATADALAQWRMVEEAWPQ